MLTSLLIHAHESVVLYESNDHKHEQTTCQQRYFPLQLLLLLLPLPLLPLLLLFLLTVMNGRRRHFSQTMQFQNEFWLFVENAFCRATRFVCFGFFSFSLRNQHNHMAWNIGFRWRVFEILFTAELEAGYFVRSVEDEQKKQHRQEIVSNNSFLGSKNHVPNTLQKNKMSTTEMSEDKK